jgi:hypothetical protein
VHMYSSESLRVRFCQKKQQEGAALPGPQPGSAIRSGKTSFPIECKLNKT